MPPRLPAIFLPLFSGLALTLALALAPSAIAAPADFYGLEAKDIFAFNQAYRDAELPKVEAAGVGLMRQEFLWRNIETTPGVYKWTKYDAFVRDTAKRGIEVMPVLIEPPAFRSSNPSGSEMSPPKNYGDLGDFGAVVSARYGTNGTFWTANPTIPKVPIRRFQIWNEPNIPRFWPDGVNPAQYAAMLKAVYPKIKAADPGSEVVSAGISEPQNPCCMPLREFVTKMYQAGVKGSLDTLALHPYWSNAAGSITLVEAARKIMDDAGDTGSALRISEIGWATGGPTYFYNQTEAGQATQLRTLYTELARRRVELNVKGIVWTIWRDHPPPEEWTQYTGLERTDGSAKPAYDAYKAVAAGTAPSPSFGYSPPTPVSGQEITFNSTSTDPDGQLVAQNWDLDGDGAYDDDSGATVKKTFNRPGTYQVGLQVRDDSGAVRAVKRAVTVANRAPSATFTYTPASPLSGEAVSFDSTSTDPDGTIASQAWDLDNDGAYDDGSGTSASQTFAAPGTYTVGLRVTDDSGAPATTSRTITVANRAPTAFFTYAPAQPLTGEQVTFSSSSNDPDGTIASQAWDLDHDGQFDDATGTSATKTFSTPGTYDIALRVTDNSSATDTTTQQVVVGNRPPTAAFTYSPSDPTTGEAVSFSSTSSDPDGTLTQAWDLDGDGAYDDGTASTATQTFATPGDHTVGLRVTDNSGAVRETTRTLTVTQLVAPHPSFTYTPASPASGDEISFSSTSSDDGRIVAQGWDLDGDGSFDDGTATTAKKTFAQPGDHVVGLRVRDDSGLVRTATRTVTVSNRGPTAAFGFTPPSPLSGEEVTFSSSSSDPDGSIASQRWDLDGDGAFDDGTAATVKKAFATPGTRTVTLEVTDDSGDTATVQHDVSVGNRPPSPSFTYSPPDPTSAEQITFSSTASDPDGTIASQAWDLDGDGTYNDGSNATATKTFSQAGDYTVGLRVTDDLGVVRETTRTVTVGSRRPSAAFDFAPAAPKSGEEVTFTSHSSDSDGTIASQAWDLDNDGEYDDGTGATATRTFATPGDHTVGLQVTDNSGDVDTVSRQVTVANRPPTPAFNFTPPSPLTGQEVTFTSSSSDPDGTLTQAWDLDNDGQYDDGSASTATKTFATPGDHTVGLRVTDDSGAVRETSRTVSVGNRPPSADFTSTPANPATGQQVSFSSTSSDPDGTIASQAWDLDDDGAYDDGSASTATKTFATPGTHTVRLRVTDDSNDTDTVSRQVTVANRPPDPAFTYSPNDPASGQTVTFESSSNDPDGKIEAQAWDLDGDGAYNDGSAPTASTTFETPGDYTVGLRVEDNSGVTRETTRSITVAEPSSTPPPPGPTGTPGSSGGGPLTAQGLAGAAYSFTGLPARKLKMRSLLRRGLRITLTCLVPCHVTAELRASSGGHGKVLKATSARKRTLLKLTRSLGAGRSTLVFKPRRRDWKWLKRARGLRVSLKATVIAVGGGTPVEIVRRATVRR